MKFSLRRLELLALLLPVLVFALLALLLRSREQVLDARPDGAYISRLAWAPEMPGSGRRLDIWIGWQGEKPAWWGQPYVGASMTGAGWKAVDPTIIFLRDKGNAGGYYDEKLDVYRSGSYFSMAETPHWPARAKSEVVIALKRGATFKIYQRVPVDVKFTPDGEIRAE